MRPLTAREDRMRTFWRIVWEMATWVSGVMNRLSSVHDFRTEVDDDESGMMLRLRIAVASIKATAAFNGGGPTAVDDREWEWDDAPSGGASAADRAFNPGFDRG